MTKSRVVKNYLFNLIYQLLLVALPLVTLPYVSRALGADGVGAFGYANSIALLFTFFGTLGGSLYGVREIASVQNDREARTRVFTELATLRICSVGLCTAAYWVVFAGNGEYGLLFRILALEVGATAFDISWFFHGMEEFKITVARNAIIKLAGAGLVFLLVKTPEDLPLYTLCMTLPILLGNVSLWTRLPKYIGRPVFRWSSARAHLWPMLVMFIPQIALEVYTVLDKTMIGLLSPEIAQVGYYTQAQQIIKVALRIFTSLGTVMLPSMAFAHAEGRREEIVESLLTSGRFILCMGCPLMFGVMGVAGHFTPWFYGPGFEPVAPLMGVMAPIALVVGLSNVFGTQYLVPTRQQKAYNLSIVAGAVVNIGLNWLLIPRFQGVGAAMATVAAESCVTGVQLWHVRNQLPLGRFFRMVGRYLALSAPVLLVTLVLGRAVPANIPGTLLLVAAGAGAYGLLLALTRDPLLARGREMVSRKLRREVG